MLGMGGASIEPSSLRNDPVRSCHKPIYISHCRRETTKEGTMVINGLHDAILRADLALRLRWFQAW